MDFSSLTKEQQKTLKDFYKCFELQEIEVYTDDEINIIYTRFIPRTKSLDNVKLIEDTNIVQFSKIGSGFFSLNTLRHKITLDSSDELSIDI